MISYAIYLSFSLFILQCQRSSCLVDSTVLFLYQLFRAFRDL